VSLGAAATTDAVVFNIAAGGKGGTGAFSSGPDGLSQAVLTTGDIDAGASAADAQ
jgi:hypothetical protein